MKRITYPYILLVFFVLFAFGCNQRQKIEDVKPQSPKTCSVRGYLDVGNGQLVEMHTLRAISKDGINVTGDGEYLHGDECTLRIYRTATDKAVSVVFFNYTAPYNPMDLPTDKYEYDLRRKPNIPNADPDDIYFRFNVLGDVKFIIKLKDNAGVDVGKE